MPITGYDPELKLIEGFKLRVERNELAEHLKARAAHHRKRADEQESELPKLREVMESLKAHGKQLATATVSTMGKGGTYVDHENPIQELERSITDHRNKAIVFDWFSTHLLDADYVLDESALRRLEILK
jgi:hypothetical protein